MKNFAFVLLIVLIAFFLRSCKKDDPIQPIPPPADIKVIRGNHQIGYPYRPLADTILIQVTPKSAADLQAYSYSFASSRVDSEVSIVNGLYMIKAVWRLSNSPALQQLTFFVYANCADQYFKCNPLDSITLTATLNTPWELVFENTSGSYGQFRDVHFSDAMNGIVVGDHTVGLLKTRDGGLTWNAANTIRQDLYDLSFSGKDTGLVIVTNNYAYFTNDGGDTFIQGPWSPPIAGDRSSSDYLMLSRNVIFTVGPKGAVLKSVDGGQNWIKYPGFNFLNQLRSIACPRETVCYVCGDIGKIIKTTDAGTTWKEQEVLINNYLKKIYFRDDQFGFAGGQYGALVRTTNGGNNWTVVKSGLKHTIIDIHFFSDSIGYVVSELGEIAKTIDGGLTWDLVVSYSYGVYTLNKIFFIDPTVVYGLAHQSIVKYNLK
jgi:photosystem II stability/assembly factor-like uncharacterized protein